MQIGEAAGAAAVVVVVAAGMVGRRVGVVRTTG
jgi:hypothetical protein